MIYGVRGIRGDCEGSERESSRRGDCSLASNAPRFHPQTPDSLEAELEHHATGLRSAHTSHVPGLLRTTDHAREIFRQVVPEFSRSDIEHRVSRRLQHQAP
ncbi:MULTISPECIES: Scr1 family TA system antitoxin-like transcriptional regulator [unclassified Streptomyces]|uniref:Scr1 family TA system antitoxin-like transcriptional regulator n=1 Tax=unclassified Streptomyces TaxID=2593676 RepID=UPI003820B1CA